MFLFMHLFYLAFPSTTDADRHSDYNNTCTNGKNCVNTWCVKIYTEMVDWNDSRTMCNYDGSSTQSIIIEDSDFQDYFQNITLLFLPQNSFVWLNARTIYGNWSNVTQWLDNSHTPFNYTNFRDSLSLRDACLTINTTDGFWYSKKCDEIAYYACFYQTPGNNTVYELLDHLILCASVGIILLNICLFFLYKFWKSKRKETTTQTIRTKHDSRIKKSSENNEYSVPKDPPENLLKNDTLWLDPERLQINYETPLGTGFSAKVFRARLIGTAPLSLVYKSIEASKFRDCQVAVKIASEYGNDEGIMLQKELDIMKILGYNEYIISLLGWSKIGQRLSLVVELCVGDLLSQVQVKFPETLPYKEIFSILWQISKGMEYIASKHIIHRDLAARNILLMEQFTAKISDFGLCCHFDDATLSYQASQGKKLPMKWLSLEALNHRKFSEKSDVWSFGILMYEAFSAGKVPYATMENDDILEFLNAGNRLACPEGTPIEPYMIMLSCWKVEPEKRPSFKDLVEKFHQILMRETQDYGYLS